MISPEEEARILARAYVPEHVVSLMTLISRGEPFLIGDHLGFSRDNWLIVVGYPLEHEFSVEQCERVLERAIETFRPVFLWFIGPAIPPFLADRCRERGSDRYYTLDVEGLGMTPALRRGTAHAAAALTVERGRVFSREHEALVEEFLARAALPPRERELYLAMPGYVGHSATAWTLDARDRGGRLCAFSVVDLGAANFTTYLLGAYSRRHYAPHASDLLFLEMVGMTREQGKRTINLGLGVHEGIRRFKEKWGGKPSLPYEFCECRYDRAKKVSLIDALLGRL